MGWVNVPPHQLMLFASPEIRQEFLSYQNGSSLRIMSQLALPSALEPWRPQFEASVRPYVHIAMELCGDATPMVSKFGGYPYLPPGEAYPMLEGEPMVLLAQINWAEVPPLPDYPTKGILQIFTPRFDDSYGYASDDKPGERTAWALRWYPNPGQSQTDFSFLPSDLELYEPPAFRHSSPPAIHVTTPFEFPANLLRSSRGFCYKLAFKAKTGPVLSRDGAFNPLISSQVRAWYFWDHIVGGDEGSGHDLWQAFDALHPPTLSKIGGYAGFSQDDPRLTFRGVGPREAPAYDNSWVLLLQMDSEGGLMWGDMGVANFFIRRDDLLRQDFFSVWYHWDCS